jgi:exoribonuclease R
MSDEKDKDKDNKKKQKEEDHIANVVAMFAKNETEIEHDTDDYKNALSILKRCEVFFEHAEESEADAAYVDIHKFYVAKRLHEHRFDKRVSNIDKYGSMWEYGNPDDGWQHVHQNRQRQR